jgi:TRAP-type mannitol/chloroaromatic compound transport system permease small subunit
MDWRWTTTRATCRSPEDKHKVKVIRTPQVDLRCADQGLGQDHRRLSKEDPFFAKVVESQRRGPSASPTTPLQRGRLQGSPTSTSSAKLRPEERRIRTRQATGRRRRCRPASCPPDRMINRLLYGIDQLSKSVGHAFAWCIVVFTLGTCYEVFVRYVLNAPTSWAFDMSYILYGGDVPDGRRLHAVAQRPRARRRLLPPVAAARAGGLELVLYILFFFPGVIALVISGWATAVESMRCGEVSVNSPVGVPIWQLKMLIPFAGALLPALQGIAEVAALRAVPARRPWPPRLHDVEELEDAIAASGARKAKARPETTVSDPGHRPGDAGAVHLHHHARVSHRLHADRDGRRLRLLRLLPADQAFFDNRVFYLLVQNTFSVMNNDVLTAVPLFLFMGYMVERSNILDRLFYSLQLAFHAARARCAGRGGADHLRAVRHRDRHRRRGGDADGPARVSADAQGGLRPEILGRRDLRRRHPRHPDSAVDHAHRLCGDLRGVGGEALCRGAVSRASCWPGMYVLYIVARVVINPKLAPKLPEEQSRTCRSSRCSGAAAARPSCRSRS